MPSARSSCTAVVARARRGLTACAVLAGALLAAGCSVTFPRNDCSRDLDCPAGEVCFPDDQCIPVGVAIRRGGRVGEDCSSESGADVGCERADEVCRMRRCVGPGGVVACEGTPDNGVPLFGGASSASSDAPDAIIVSWAPAADESPHDQLTYRVFMSTTEGEFDFAAPVATLVGGVQHRQTGLSEGTTYFFLVRATDPQGLADCNDSVVSATPRAAGACVDYQDGIRPILEANCVRCHAGEAPPQNLRLDSYEGVLAGGRSGNEVVKCQADASLIYLKVALDDPPVGARMPLDGPPFLSEGQIELIRRWVEEGARRTCADADVCSDAVPPEFGGLTTATATSPTTAELCWNPGSDSATPAPELIYDVYASSASGGQDFGRVQASSAPGAGCVTLDTRSPGDRSCYVVRARDGAGNHDDNTVERCVDQPALPSGCVDYATHIQPLFDRNCVRCHSGRDAPQGLRLSNHAEVISGSVRRTEVDACNAAGSLLAAKLKPNPPVGRRMPLDGPPYLEPGQIAMVEQWIANGAQSSCTGTTVCGDTQAPVFGGVTSATATSPTNIQVCWAAPSDDTTPADAIRVDLYESLGSGGQVFGEPAQHSTVNSLCADIPVGPGTELCVVGRARDLVGNTTANTEERCATAPASDCSVEYDAHIRPILASRCNHCHSAGNPPRFLDLSSYPGLLAGGSLRNELRACDPGASFLLQKIDGAVCGRRMPFDGPPWLGPSQRSVIDRWIASGGRERCTQASPCADVAAPTFAGAASATAVDASTARVCWAAASDDTSAGTAITYEIYEAASPGGQDFGAPASYAGLAGTTCHDIPVAPAQRTCFVVRARDLRGNRDQNTVERCVTPPAGCVDYGSRVQTIFSARCIQCHSGSGAPDGIQWDSYDHAIDTGDVEACDEDAGDLVDVIQSCEMPRDTSLEMCSTRACLTPSQLRLIRAWINQGASPTCPSGGC